MRPKEEGGVWGSYSDYVTDLEWENQRLLDLLQDIEGIVRDTSYRVPGDPESPSKGARIVARIRAVLGHAASEQSDESTSQGGN